jgi:hypothetical protein
MSCDEEQQVLEMLLEVDRLEQSVTASLTVKTKTTKILRERAFVSVSQEFQSMSHFGLVLLSVDE